MLKLITGVLELIKKKPVILPKAMQNPGTIEQLNLLHSTFGDFTLKLPHRDIGVTLLLSNLKESLERITLLVRTMVKILILTAPGHNNLTNSSHQANLHSTEQRVQVKADGPDAPLSSLCHLFPIEES